MTPAINLGEFEQLILLAILRLGDRAYGVTIRTEISERAGRTVAPGALYTALDRLEDKGIVKSRFGEPSPQRGGRAKRFFTVTALGAQALARAQRAFQQMLEGLDVLRGAHA
jgi:DNA-binding PadR family transcriptional regulator